MNETIKVTIAFSLKKLIGDTIYTIKYTLAKVKIIYNLMNNVKEHMVDLAVRREWKGQ